MCLHLGLNSQPSGFHHTRVHNTTSCHIIKHSVIFQFMFQLNMLVEGVVYCLLEPLAASINPSNDHWALRDYAARLLAQITW